MEIIEAKTLQVVIIKKENKSEDFDTLWDRHDNAIRKALDLAIEDPQCAELLDKSNSLFLESPLVSEQINELGMIVCRISDPFYIYLKLRKCLLNNLRAPQQ